MTSPRIKTAARMLSMTLPGAPAPARRLPVRPGTLLMLAIMVAVVVLYGPRIPALVAGAHPHGLDVALFMAQPLVFRIHILGAVATIGLGALILALPKGSPLHRAMGWAWVSLMATAAGSSLFMVGLNGDYWSFIHILSGFTLVSLPIAVAAARRHNVNLHRRTMTGLFWGASIVAGVFAFLPGRLMWALFMG